MGANRPFEPVLSHATGAGALHRLPRSPSCGLALFPNMSETPSLPPPPTLAAATRQRLLAGADPNREALELAPRLRGESRDSVLAYARAFLEQGLHGMVAVILQDAVMRWPEDAELKFWLGNAMRIWGQPQAAEHWFREVMKQQPAHEGAAQALAFMLRDNGRLNAASQVMVDLYQRLGGGAERCLRSVEFLEGCRRYAAAAQLCRQELARGTADPRLSFFGGQMEMLLGNFEAARTLLIAAVDQGLDVNTWSGVWLFLSSTLRYKDADHPDLARFERAWRDARLDEGARAAAAFAHGKASDDLGRYEQAAAAFREANALARGRYPWSQPQWRAKVEALLGAPLPPSLQARADRPVPVFVVGLPRSGTTLAAELLGRHPQVRNRGERSWIPYLDEQLAAAQGHSNPAALHQAAEIYRAHLVQDDPPAGWYIDKNPLNFRHLGLIAAMLPEARIIHCRRDRRDTALSIWCQLFAHQDNNYAYDWKDIAAFAEGEERLMRHWQALLPGRIHSLDYHRLAEAPAQTLAELSAFLGLPQQDLVNTAPKADSAIATSSVWQARQPVYRSSIGRWQAYAPYIPELESFSA